MGLTEGSLITEFSGRALGREKGSRVGTELDVEEFSTGVSWDSP